MKSIYFILCIFLIPFNLKSQEKELSKKEKKAIEKEAELDKIYHLIDSRMFVVEVEQIIFNDGKMQSVNPTSNFFMFDKITSRIQITYNFPIDAEIVKSKGTTYYGDKNGISMEATIDKYELKERKGGKPIILSGSLDSFRGHSLFSISVNSSGMASVTLRDKNGDQMVFRGLISSISESKAYLN
jgi:hypothetical protein